MAAVTAGGGCPPAHLLLAQICVRGSETDALTENPLHAELQFRLLKSRAASLPADGVLVAQRASSPPSADSSGDRGRQVRVAARGRGAGITAALQLAKVTANLVLDECHKALYKFRLNPRKNKSTARFLNQTN